MRKCSQYEKLDSLGEQGIRRLVDENLLYRFCLLNGRDLTMPTADKRDLVGKREGEIPEKVSCF